MGERVSHGGIRHRALGHLHHEQGPVPGVDPNPAELPRLPLDHRPPPVRGYGRRACWLKGGPARRLGTHEGECEEGCDRPAGFDGPLSVSTRCRALRSEAALDRVRVRRLRSGRGSARSSVRRPRALHEEDASAVPVRSPMQGSAACRSGRPCKPELECLNVKLAWTVARSRQKRSRSTRRERLWVQRRLDLLRDTPLRDGLGDGLGGRREAGALLPAARRLRRLPSAQRRGRRRHPRGDVRCAALVRRPARRASPFEKDPTISGLLA